MLDNDILELSRKLKELKARRTNAKISYPMSVRFRLDIARFDKVMGYGRKCNIHFESEAFRAVLDKGIEVLGL